MSTLRAVLLLLVFSATATAQVPVSTELLALQHVFVSTVSCVTVEESYKLLVHRDIIQQLRASPLTSDACAPHYLVYVDRNPNQQRILVAYSSMSQPPVYDIGWDYVSTGNPKRAGHFITPTGVFVNSTQSIGYRALGTKNANGWRGLGRKGSRVWDFGWQWTEHQHRGVSDPRQIRLLLHATDPDFGEARLGTTDSKGCVRISAKLNYFLDHYGILDYEYEREKERFSWLLDPAREPVSGAGHYIVIGDSSESYESLLIAKNP